MSRSLPIHDPAEHKGNGFIQKVGAGTTILALIIVLLGFAYLLVGENLLDRFQPSRMQERQQQALVVMGLYQQDITSIPGCRALSDSQQYDSVPRMQLRTSPDSTSATFVVSSLRWVADGLDGAVTIREGGEYPGGSLGYLFHVECARRTDLYRVGNLLRNRATGNLNRVPEILN